MIDLLTKTLFHYDGAFKEEAHAEMMSYGRPSHLDDILSIEGLKESAVCISLFQQKDQLYFPIIQRTRFGVHSGQLALPGGKLEKGESHWEAAIRESNEELGMSIKLQKHIGVLSPVYIPPSNFIVYPQVSIYNGDTQFTPEEKEVQQYFNIPLENFVGQDILKQKVYIPKLNAELMVPSFSVENQVLWGATAMILNELRWVIKNI